MVVQGMQVEVIEVQVQCVVDGVVEFVCIGLYEVQQVVVDQVDFMVVVD